MAFWGVEVKSGRPFTHRYDDSKGRLHISMATLGSGSATTRSTLQCNVGNRSPVFLCALYPGSTESLQLNLELEEDDDVVFSVIGARSIHLCGYYLAKTSSHRAMFDGDSSESYGEDIADTESEQSDCSDEDDSDDSFIDDNPIPEVFPPSPSSNQEEDADDNKPNGKKSKRGRLRKKYYSVESDDDGDGGFEEKTIVDDGMDDQTKEIDTKDTLPISSVYKSKACKRIFEDEVNTGDRGALDARNKNCKDDGDSKIQTKLETDDVLLDSQRDRESAVSGEEKDVRDVKKSKKTKKEKKTETKSSPDGSIKLDKSEDDKPKIDKMTQDILPGQEQNMDVAGDGNKARRKNLDEEIHKTGDSDAFDARNKNDKDDANSIIQTALETDVVLQDSQMHREAALSEKKKDVGDVKKSKKKKKEKESKSSPIKLDKSEKGKPKIDNMTLDILAGQEQIKDGGDDENKARRKNLDKEINETGDGDAFDARNKNDEDDTNSVIQTALETDNVLQDSQMHRDKKKDVGDVKKSKKKKKEKETKSFPKIDKMDLDILAGQEQIKDKDKDGGNDDKQAETVDKGLPFSEVGHVQDEKPKKKRKERLKEHIEQPTVNEDVEKVAVVALPAFAEDDGKAKTKKRKKEKVNKGSHPEGDIGNHEGNEEHQKLMNEKSVEDCADDFSNGIQTEEKVKKGKSKSKSKSKGNIEVNEK